MNSPMQPLEPRRFFAAGDPVTSFGRQGLATMPYPLYSVNIGDVAAAPGGKFLAGLDFQRYSAAEGVPADFVRFDANGQPDLTFGTSGLGTSDSFLTTVRRIAVRRDGYFYAFGSDSEQQIYISDEANWYVARFRPDGAIDRRFGDRGHVQLNLSRLGSLGSSTIQNNVTLDADGRVTLLARYRIAPRVYADAVVRFDASGARDPAWHRGRPVLIDGALESARPSLATATDGATYVAYNRTRIGARRATVMRITPRGGVDNAYGRNGYAAYLDLTVTFPVLSIAEDNSGSPSVYAGGAFNEDRGSLGYAHTTVLSKLTGGGIADPTFAGDGRVEWDDQIDGSIDVVAVPDGRVITVGTQDSRVWNADGTQDTAAGQFGLGDRPFARGDVIYSTYGSSIGATQLADNGTSPSSLGPDGTLQINGTGRHDYLSIKSESDFASSEFPYLAFGNAGWSRSIRADRVKRIIINGGSGDDQISATLFRGRVGAADPKLIIYGGPGTDFIDVYNYRATVYGGSGDDYVRGNRVIDTEQPAGEA